MRADERQQTEFLEMLRQCEGTLLKVCLYFTDRRRESVRDLYQEIACVLWESWPKYRGESKLNTWVTGIALNVAGQELRKRNKAPLFVELDESLCDTLADEQGDSLYRRLYRLIDRLGNDGDRKLLFLYLDGKSNHEIAGLTGLTVVSVKKRLHRIKIKLKELNTQEDE